MVAARADHLCEYCLIHEDDTFFGCEVDHIISQKHGGPTEAENLAYACMFCNRYKGSDIGSILPQTGKFSRFFNPRVDRWSDHFVLHEVVIKPVTAIGEVTAAILRFNASEQLLEREALREIGHYPSVGALRRITRSS